MTYYESPNEYPLFNCVNPFYWRVQSSIYNQSMNKTYITIVLGYKDDEHTETRILDEDLTEEPELAVIENLAEYEFSTGPIHGGGFPIRK